MVRIGAYETIKGRMTNGQCYLPITYTWVLNHRVGKKPSTSQLVISGAVAGGLGGVAGNPADIVLVRMTTDARLPAEKQRNYRNAIDGVIRIVRDEGASALMRGVGPNTVSTHSKAADSQDLPQRHVGSLTTRCILQVRAVLMTSSQMATCVAFGLCSSSPSRVLTLSSP